MFSSLRGSGEHRGRKPTAWEGHPSFPFSPLASPQVNGPILDLPDMQLLDLTLPTPAENIALDEALLLYAEQSGEALEFLRLWEPPAPLVVVGRGSNLEKEVDLEACRRDGVPVFRRASGGLAIVAAPGCLMYAVVLSHFNRPGVEAVDVAHRLVKQTLLSTLQQLDPRAAHAGTSDLVIGDRKFSGNSLRCKRTQLLYHGTLLYDMDLSLVSKYLHRPHREPDYREGRPHDTFLTQLDTEAASLRRAVIDAWKPGAELRDWPRELTEQLAREKYPDLVAGAASH